jgi:hypothetical protein
MVGTTADEQLDAHHAAPNKRIEWLEPQPKLLPLHQEVLFRKK